jgi:hypothetical protein
MKADNSHGSKLRASLLAARNAHSHFPADQASILVGHAA